jgi:hypothetical protein
MLGHSQEMVWQAWWMPTIPGVAITLLVLAFNLMGDRLRDVLRSAAPRTRASLTRELSRRATAPAWREPPASGVPLPARPQGA